MIARIFACFLCTLIANGLARFGYVVLIPILSIKGVLSKDQSLALGVAVLFGYIFGSVFINMIKQYASLESIAKICLLFIAFSFFAFMIEGLFVWVWIWRFIAGIASASLIILASPLSLPYIRQNKRGKVAGFIFAGVGIGAVLNGLFLPSIAEQSLNLVWGILGGVSLASFIFSLFTLKSKNLPKVKDKATTTFNYNASFYLLIIIYTSISFGYLPHTLFWTDYLVNTLGFSSVIAGKSFMCFGIGAACGSMGGGMIADKIGLKKAYILMFIAQTISCVMAAFLTTPLALSTSIYIMGFACMGATVITMNLALKIVGKASFSSASSMLTFLFAVFQAISSFAITYILPFIGYFTLFIISAIILGVATLLIPKLQTKDSIL